MIQHVYKRNWWRTVVAGSFVAMLYLLLAGLCGLALIEFFIEHDLGWRAGFALLFGLVCIFLAVLSFYLFIANSQTVIVTDDSLKVGARRFKWQDLTEWDLHTKRPTGLLVDRRFGSGDVPVAVFVFGSEEEIRIYYRYYNDREQLLIELEQIMSRLHPATAVESESTTCPRCLGKGYVSDEDITRLHKRRVWEPGECLLCKGTGVVQQ